MFSVKFVILGALLSFAAAEAPLGQYPLAAPARAYGPPRIELPAPPPPALPVPVYSAPRIELPIPHPAPVPIYSAPRIELPIPHPAPVPVYSAPRIELPIPHLPAPVQVYAAPAPLPVQQVVLPPPQIISDYAYTVHTPPKPIILPAPTPVLPAPVYSLPQHEIVRQVVPIASSYHYDVPQYIPRVLKSYAAPAPILPSPILPAPVLPAPVYSAPRLAIPAQQYGVPQF